jgi:selenocysteine lyase/cysteine desulfurase
MLDGAGFIVPAATAAAVAGALLTTTLSRRSGSTMMSIAAARAAAEEQQRSEGRGPAQELAAAAAALAQVSGGYGQPLRSRFGLETGYVQLNHGSFGTCPKSVNEARKALLDRVECNPDAWIGHHGPERSYRQLMGEAKELIAAETHTEATDLVLVENASSGINAVMRSITWKEGDKILYLDCAYGMVQNVLRYLVKTCGVELVRVVMAPTGFASEDAVLAAVAAVLAQHGGPAVFRCAILSHITSVPAVILPVQRFCAMLAPTPVVVDGAHALGQLDVDIPSLGCAAYTGNLHKWLYSPKGTAMLWAAPWFQSQCAIVPPVLSSESGGDNFAGDFEYTGTRDYTGYCAIPAAFAFRDSLPGADGTPARTYGHLLAVWAGCYLAQRFGTRVMSPPSMVGWITNVELPVADAQQMGRIKKQLLDNHYTNVTFYSWAGRCWQRLSCPVYLSVDEITEYAERALALIAADGDKTSGSKPSAQGHGKL